MKKTIAILALAALGITTVNAGVSVGINLGIPVPAPVVVAPDPVLVPPPMPAPVVEAVPACPVPGYLWVGGGGGGAATIGCGHEGIGVLRLTGHLGIVWHTAKAFAAGMAAGNWHTKGLSRAALRSGLSGLKNATAKSATGLVARAARLARC